jgi:threonine/homoserine/homoserine lactone efflux protein
MTFNILGTGLSAPDLATFVLGVVVVLSVPGPTNTLLAAAGLRQGFRRSARLAGAELAGYLLSISLWGLLLVKLGAAHPWLAPTVRTASGLYIAYLAVRMWNAAAQLPEQTKAAIGMRTLFVATVLNPKAILFAGTIFPAAAFVAWQPYALSMVLFAGLLAPIALCWIAFGAQLGSGRLTWLNPAYLQRGAAVVLVGFSLSLGWSVLHTLT